jgi:hypothetical protein
MPRKCAMGPFNGFLPGGTILPAAGIEDAMDHWEGVKSVDEINQQQGLKPIQDEDGNIIMHHWSNQKGIEVLDPTKQGTGLRSSNFRAGYDGKDQILYSSFGLNVGHPRGYKKEEALGGVEYISKMPIERIYDIALDPQYLRVRRDEIIAEMEAKHNARFNQGGGPQVVFHKNRQLKDEVMVQLIKDAGYAGFFMANDKGYGLTAAIWEPTAVEQVKPRTDAQTISNESKMASMLEGWRITPEEIEIARANRPKNEWKQPEDLEKLGLSKVEQGINLDEDYEWAQNIILKNDIALLGSVQKIPTFREMIMALKAKAPTGLIRQGGGDGYKRINNGTRVKSRLDIPAYEKTDTWIVTVHDLKGGVIGYAKSAVLNNVEFDQFSKAANKIAGGVRDSKGRKATKSTFATMKGDWVDLNERQAEQMANEALNDPENWVEVGMNPIRYGYFYVKETGEKILSSSQVIQVGPLVMAKRDGIVESTPHSEIVEDALGKASSRILQVAKQYRAKSGIVKPETKIYRPVNPKFATRVAMAYDAMKHTPRKKDVAEAYDALINETIEQYKTILESGLQVEFIPSGQQSPYAYPSEAVKDIIENNHMWVYSTRDGYGKGEQKIEHPMLAPTAFMISGEVALANDLFRVVHDYFGHAKNGVGFRAEGEESAFISHASMYSDLAVKALASETRGQNSWVNFGPFAKQNRTASEEDTVYAPQKAGLLPEELSNPKNPPA